MAIHSYKLYLIIDNSDFLYTMRIIMTKKPTINAGDVLIKLGGEIRAQRKALRVNATAAAEASGISRVTLHRVERGEPSVHMGAYVNLMLALGLNLAVDSRTYSS